MNKKLKPAKRSKEYPFPKLIDYCRIINDPFQIPEHSFIAAISSDIDDPDYHYQFYEVVSICRVDNKEVSLYLVEVDNYGKVFTKSKYKSNPTKFDKLKLKGYTTNWLCEKGEYFLLFDTISFYIKKSTYIKPDSNNYNQRFIFFDENGYPDATDDYKSKFQDYDPEFDLDRDQYNRNIKCIEVPSRGNWNIRNSFRNHRIFFEQRKKVADDLINIKDMDVHYYSPWIMSKGHVTDKFRQALNQLNDEDYDKLLDLIIATRDLCPQCPTYTATREIKKYCSKWPGVWKHVRRLCYEESMMFLEAYNNS